MPQKRFVGPILALALVPDVGLARAHLASFQSAIAQSDDGMQCGNRLVTLGETKTDVVLKCGEPMFKEARVDPYGRRPPIFVEEWTYHMGRGRFLRILTFRNGVLFSIKAGAFVDSRR